MKTLNFTADLQNRLNVGNEPAWASRVDRWYQLDEMGFAFCEALHEWDYLEAFERPDIIFLALEEASNPADFDFIATGGQSPAKFVYTLPNISASVIFQMIKIHGKVYCLSAGQDTLAVTLKEAESFATHGKQVWVFSSPAQSENKLTREINFYSF